MAFKFCLKFNAIFNLEVSILNSPSHLIDNGLENYWKQNMRVGGCLAKRIQEKVIPTNVAACASLGLSNRDAKFLSRKKVTIDSSILL